VTGPAHPAAAATPWHLAGSLVSLLNAVNAHWPNRSKVSDGGIGDAAHQAEGSASDHNPWLNNTVRAYDFTAAGIDAPWLAETLRKLGQHGDPRLVGGGYVIWNSHITSEDWTHWVAYTGDPHTSHVHVSVSRNPAGYENGGPWDIFAQTPIHPPAPAPAPAPGDDGPYIPPTGHDLTGDGDDLRGHIGDQGPRVKELQHELNVEYPRYSHLPETEFYGHQTAAVLEEFSHRAAVEPQTPDADRDGLAHSDGEDLGPRTAHALHQRGLI
jgi:hypothetical protein